MKDFLATLFICLMIAAGFYKIGYERAQLACEARATTATQKIEDAVSRASEALSGASKNLDVVEGQDDTILKEIENEATARGAVCAVPADRLRVLDKIGG